MDLYYQLYQFLMFDVGFEASIYGDFISETLTTVALCCVVLLPFFVVYKLIKNIMELEF